MKEFPRLSVPISSALSKKGKTILALLMLCLVFLQCSPDKIAGGGADVGNPVKGVVAKRNGTPIDSAMIILGSYDEEIYDTVYSDPDGKFLFLDKKEGRYAAVGKKDSLLGIAKVNQDSVSVSEIFLILDEPVTITIFADSSAADTNLAFTRAMIAGTPYQFEVDSAGDLYLDPAPAGNMSVVVHADNGISYEFTKLKPIGGCDAYIVVEAGKPPEEWNSEDCGARDPLATPYITWASPPPGAVGAVARVNRKSPYDIAIQFSHPMDTRNTANAITVGSTDSLTSMYNMTWQGSDMLFIEFCRKKTVSGNLCSRSSLYDVGVTYNVIIDTTAKTGFGVNFAAPETLSFLPEPFPRLKTVTGFRFSASASFEVIDSLPTTISLGDSVSPAIAYQAGNRIDLAFAGRPLASTLRNGIRCFEEDTSTVNCTITQLGTGVSIAFPELLKSGTNYKIEIDTAVKFEESINLSQAQTIKWKTLQFTIDNALLLGTYNHDTTVSLITNSQPRFSSVRFQSMTPQLPYTSFYASTIIDSNTIGGNISVPSYFSSDTLIVDSSKFGWKSGQWIEPGKEYEFVILPGLRSLAGDSIGDTVRYTIKTDSFELKQAGVFGLLPRYSDGTYSLPKQDSVYEIAIGEIVYRNGIIDFAPKSYRAFISHNAPVDSVSAKGKFNITPNNGFRHTFGTARAGLEYRNTDMLIPDTLLKVSLAGGVRDTFGNTSSDTFEFRFRTEEFGLRIGNLFGVYFGYPKEKLSQELPNLILPDITIIGQGIGEGEPLIWTFKEDHGLHALAADMYPNPIAVERIFAFGDSATAIGIESTRFTPGFSDSANFLSFSGVPDSNDYVNYVKITPNDGSIDLRVEDNKLRFSTSTYCRPGTTYTIRIDEGFHDVHGRTLGDSVVVSFTTPGFALAKANVGSEIMGRDSIVQGNAFLEKSTRKFYYGIDFTHPLKVSSVEGNATISPPVSGIMEVVTTSASFVSSQILIPDTTYRIAIAGGIKEWNGVKLDTSYSLTFQTEGFKVESIQVGTRERGELFSVSTNSRLDTNSFASAMQISPVRYQTGTCSLSSDSAGFFFVPDSTILFGAEVKIAIDSTLADVYGNTLSKPDSLSFIVTTMKHQ